MALSPFISTVEKHYHSNEDDLLSLFDYWTGPSEEFRQYLWAHRPEDVEKAREIVSVLSVEETLRILRYLISDYWRRYVGWPDLLVHNRDDYFFVEVKSSRDKLREAQKSWICGNSIELHLPFRLVKIHRKAS
jgi:hypothetical protein